MHSGRSSASVPVLASVRVGKGALAPCPPFLSGDGFGGHASLCPPYDRYDRSPYTRSMIVAVPMPPPLHSVISAVDLLVRSSSSCTVPAILAPVAPSA